MRSLILFLCFLIIVGPSIGQESFEESSENTFQEINPVVISDDKAKRNELQDEYQNQPLENSKNNNWQKARDGLQYETDKEKLEKTKKTKEESKSSSKKTSSFSWGGLPSGFGQIIAYTLALGILGFVIYYLLVNTLWVKSKNQKIKIESTHHEIDLDKVEFPELQMLLNESLNRSDFRQAIRWQFMLSLKTLTEYKLILWKRQKTNHDYIIEMASRSLFSQFCDITRVFEKVWYGNLDVNENFYKKVEPDFKLFLTQITKKGELV